MKRVHGGRSPSVILRIWQYWESPQSALILSLVSIFMPMLLIDPAMHPTYTFLAAILTAIVAFLLCNGIVVRIDEFGILRRRAGDSVISIFLRLFGELMFASPIIVGALVVFGAWFGWMAMALMLAALIGTFLGVYCHRRGAPLFPLPLSFLLPLEKLIPWVPGKSSGSLGLIILILGGAVFLVPPLMLGWSIVPVVDGFLFSDGYESILSVLLIHPFATPFLWVARGSEPMEGVILLGASVLVMIPPFVSLLHAKEDSSTVA